MSDDDKLSLRPASPQEIQESLSSARCDTPAASAFTTPTTRSAASPPSAWSSTSNCSATC